ncbi:MAG: T9SS type A sorting domain-containing protein [Fibrobacter sp.]|jgi:pectate lyase|nr:T9SS type A sorting domain-containing protein [Fibrobacter sp.]
MRSQKSSLIVLLFSAYLLAQPAVISESEGWLESVFIKWTPVAGAQRYNVYYSGEGVTDRKIDDQLIRGYGSYFRADIPGLKAGTYTIKVVPVISGVEGEAVVSGPLTVKAHDRSGFAFWNGRIPGAYKADGTPKDGAVVLYITEGNKNTVSLDVTGATENPCVGLQTILDGFKKGKDTRPLIVRLIGQITDLSYMYNGDIVIENKNNASGYITIEGIGNDAVADGWGIRIKNATNIEIRNIGFMNNNSGEGDNVGLQQNNDYIWVHNCDFFYGDAGSDADQAKGDGALDCKKSTYVTFSYNHFWDSGKSNLLGLSEGTTSGLFITYHHNWYDHSDSRHPRVRFYSAHVYNNYYDGISKYGVGATEGSSVFVEANYFRNCKYPILISMQGSDVWDGSGNDYKNKPTFSKEDGGMIKAFNNFISGQERFVPYGDQSPDYNIPGMISSTTDFDAYVATSRDEKVSGSVKSAYGENTYNNFDTDPSLMYTYTADVPEDARAKVMKYAGRVDGGDFKWAFNNAEDDDSYDVDPELKAALKGYKTTLLFVQGEGGYTAVKQQQVSADGKNIHLNPVTGRMSISAYERVKKIEVYNMAGVLVKSIIDKAESKDVDIRNLRNGSYLVRVFTEKGVFNCKLIKSDYK